MFTIVLVGGCTSPRAAAPAYLAIAPGEYERAFDAASDIARSYGMIPALRDRRAGVIETEPVIAGSIFEPWDRGTRSIEQAAENTLAFQRRRARFEFQPAGFIPHEDDAQDRDVLIGPDMLAQDRPPIDLTLIQENMELRVWVYNERAHVPGIRRSAWSRRMTTQTQVVDPATGRPLPPSWTAVSRDRALESHLMAEVAQRLGETPRPR